MKNCHHVKITNWAISAQVWNKGDLVQQTIGLSSPGQPWGGWLIRDPWQENVKMVLEEGKVPRVLISEIYWQQVEDPCTMDGQSSFSGLLDFGWCRAGDIFGDGQPSPPVTPLPVNGVTFHQPLGQLPQEANLVPLPAALLGVNSHLRELLPVSHLVQNRVSYLW